jgi:hypothetical protein
MSQSCGTDGRSLFQETVTYGELRARAQELLSPIDGTASWLNVLTSLNETVSLCRVVGGATSLSVVFAEES